MYIRADIVILFVQKKLIPVATLKSSALLHFPKGDKGERFTQHPFRGPTIIYWALLHAIDSARGHNAE